MREAIVIKGGGDLASGTAHRLFRCGYRVVITELERPTAVRRNVSFSSAVLQGRCEVEGVAAVRYGLDDIDALASVEWNHIPVVVDPRCALRSRLSPAVLIDGRMLKRNLDNSVSDAPLVIGLGPGLVAGQDVHYVIETQRGHDLGRIIARGSGAADTGTPGPVDGHTVARVLRAPASGTLRVERDIGQIVQAGDRVGAVGAQALVTRIGGVIRGLLFDGADVVVGQKLGDVDPRGARSFCHTISDKARTISGAVLELVVAFSRGR